MSETDGQNPSSVTATLTTESGGMKDNEQVVKVKNKEHRKRMKGVYKQIREQMEFYFSDANLHRDRFLKKLMDESNNGFVELEVFKNFNKMKSISTDTGLIAEALKKTSTILEVSEDCLRVRRTTPLLPPENVDERTVYVECLAPNTDHEYLKRLFEPFGKVMYVSLPRYKSTHDIKGFAFIEFETIESAQKACQKVKPPAQVSEKLPLGKFPKASKKMKAMQKQVQKQESELGTKGVSVGTKSVSEENSAEEKTEKSPKVDVTPTKRSKKGKKRKQSASSELESPCEVGGKKLKVECSEEINDSKTPEKEEGAGRRKRKLELEGSGNNDNKTELKEGSELVKAKKVKFADSEGLEKHASEKVASKKKRKPNKKKTKEVKVKDVVHDLRVIPKTQWLQLKKEYLAIQKSNMAALKRSLTEIQKQKEKLSACFDEPKVKKSSPLEFVPGVIVHVSSQQPITRNELKASLPNPDDIAYVDVKEGFSEGHIRFKTSEGVGRNLETTHKDYSLKLLEGDDEKSYWDRLRADRETKLSSKKKTKKRGSEKIMEKAEQMAVGGKPGQRKHIHFGD